jgi:hypothetical protein
MLAGRREMKKRRMSVPVGRLSIEVLLVLGDKITMNGKTYQVSGVDFHNNQSVKFYLKQV